MEQKGKRPADLCKILDIGTSVTTGWKTRGTDPPAKYIIPICQFLNVSVEYLLTGSDKIKTGDSAEAALLAMYRELPSYKQEFVFDSVKAAYDKENAASIKSE